MHKTQRALGSINMCCQFDFQERLDEKKLQNCLDILQSRLCVLQCHIVERSYGILLEKIPEEDRIKIPLTVIEAEDENESASRLSLEKQLNTPFPSLSPPLRVVLHLTGTDQSRIEICCNHIFLDGVAVARIAKQIMIGYNDPEQIETDERLPADADTYSHFPFVFRSVLFYVFGIFELLRQVNWFTKATPLLKRSGNSIYCSKSNPDLGFSRGNCGVEIAFIKKDVTAKLMTRCKEEKVNVASFLSAAIGASCIPHLASQEPNDQVFNFIVGELRRIRKDKKWAYGNITVNVSFMTSVKEYGKGMWDIVKTVNGQFHHYGGVSGVFTYPAWYCFGGQLVQYLMSFYMSMKRTVVHVPQFALSNMGLITKHPDVISNHKPEWSEEEVQMMPTITKFAGGVSESSTFPHFTIGVVSFNGEMGIMLSFSKYALERKIAKEVLRGIVEFVESCNDDKEECLIE